jgi:capsular exopolysaccharide synthesis family protein
MDVDREHKVILVTSSLSAEGKSTTVCNVGLALAEAGTRVLIIDADLRRPTMAKCLSIDGTVGLTNVLVNRVSAAKAIQPVGPALDVLPSGLTPPNPSELLGSDQMANLIAGLRDSYDVILLDTSPLLPVTDAAVLAPRADGVLFVVRHGKTHVNDVQAAKDALDAVSGRVLGSVLTMVPNTGRPRYMSYTAHGEQVRQVGGPAYPVRTSGRKRPVAGADDDRTVGLVVDADGDQRRPSPTPRGGIPASGNGQQQFERESGRTSR